MHPNHSLREAGKTNRWPVDLGLTVLFSIVTAKLVVHLYASRNYGYFIDELYYLAYLHPAYPTLFAAGSVTWESWLARWRLKWLQIGYPVLMLLSGALIAPFAIPVLPVKTYLRYSQALHFQQPAIEKWKLGPLPQVYADQFGWKEMVAR